MNGELIIENYISEDDSFEDFYNKNRGKIKKALQGRKMKKRHLLNAKKLLGAIFLIPEEEQKRLILEAIGETVADTKEEGFEGAEFDHFGFAKKLRQKAERLVKRKVDLLDLKNLRNRLFRKKQVSQPSSLETTVSESQTNPGLRMRASEAKAQVIANNSKLAAPTASTPSGGGTGGDAGGGGDQGGDGSGNDDTKSTPDQGGIGGNDKTKTTEDKQADKKTADAKKAVNDKSKDTNTKDDKGTGDDKNKKKSSNKKWLFIGGGTIVLVILIIVVIALSKGSAHATTVITK